MKTIATSILILLSLSSLYSQWDTLYFDGPSIIKDVEKLGDEGYIIAIDNSNLLRYQYATNQIDTVYYNNTYTFTDLFFLNADTGFAVSFPNSVFKTTNGGVSWTLQNNSSQTGVPVSSQKDALLFVDDLVGYYTTSNAWGGSFHKTIDGGISWTQLYDYSLTQYPDLGSTSLCKHQNNNQICRVNKEYFMISNDAGVNWEERVMFNNYARHNTVKSNGNIIASCGYAATSGIVSTSIDDGITWSNYLAPEIDEFLDIEIVNDSVLYAVGRTNTGFENNIYKTTDGGINWSIQHYSTPLSFYPQITEIECTNEYSCLIGGFYNLLAHTFNGGGFSYPAQIKEHKNSLKLYPNPVSDFLNINSTKIIEKIEIYNIQGVLILKQNSSNNTNIQLNISNLAKGYYIAKTNTKNGVETVKFEKL